MRYLSADDKLSPVPAVQCSGRQPFRRAEPVALRRVEDRYARVGGPADRSDRGGLVGRGPVAAKLACAECDRGHAQAGLAERDLLHGTSLRLVVR